MHLTCDFSRAYRDVNKDRGNWVIEDYQHFLETYCIYIFSPYKGRQVGTKQD
jgi:hypothetical protein